MTPAGADTREPRLFVMVPELGGDILDGPWVVRLITVPCHCGRGAVDREDAGGILR